MNDSECIDCGSLDCLWTCDECRSGPFCDVCMEVHTVNEHSKMIEVNKDCREYHHDH